MFDIQQGVAICIFIKNSKIISKQIFHADLYGERDVKYAWLDKHNITNVNWKEVKPESPDYFFYPVDVLLRNQYETFWKITDIFPVSSVGVVTGRDELVLGNTKQELINNLKTFGDRNFSDEEVKKQFNLTDNGHWNVKEAREHFHTVNNWEKSIVRINYRPFDLRWLYYDDFFLERSRKAAMENILASGNLCLIFTRSISGGKQFNHVFCSNNGVLGRFYPDSACITYFSPLYTYKRVSQFGEYTKQVNINPEFLASLRKSLQKEVSPEETFYYIYAVLYSNQYRAKYLDYLKVDFPRIPVVKDLKLFDSLVLIGKQLVDLHLMKYKLESNITYSVCGSNVVTSVKFHNGCVYINKDQFFGGISRDTWDFDIGTCRILQNWLKTRKGKELTVTEIEFFMQIVEVIEKTFGCMHQIGAIPFIE